MNILFITEARTRMEIRLPLQKSFCKEKNTKR